MFNLYIEIVILAISADYQLVSGFSGAVRLCPGSNNKEQSDHVFQKRAVFTPHPANLPGVRFGPQNGSFSSETCRITQSAASWCAKPILVPVNPLDVQGLARPIVTNLCFCILVVLYIVRLRYYSVNC